MDLKRRDFLKLIGATTVATAIPGCTPKEPKTLIPYVIPEEDIIPGKSVWYATVCRECPAGCGVNVRVREGRATKAEGNPFHPVNKGALCARGQASLQGLYNPDRIQSPMRKKPDGGWENLSWSQAEDFVISQILDIVRKARGSDIVWITPHLTGSLDALIDDWLNEFGSQHRYRYEPFGHEALKMANELTFGLAVIPTYDFENVDTIISFGADFLETWLSPVGFARQFSTMRGYGQKKRNYFVYVGPRLSMTAANADEWLRVHPDLAGNFALSIVNVIVSQGFESRLSVSEVGRVLSLVQNYTPENVSQSTGISSEQIVQIARKLASSSSSIAVAGGPTIEGEFGVQTIAAVNLLNFVLGNIGKSVRFGATNSISRVSSYASLVKLVNSMERGEVPALFLSDVNPAFSMPDNAAFAAAMSKVPLVVSFSSVMDETTAHASLVLPIHTPFESWGDFEPQQGTYGLMQPVMHPVFQTKMLGDILLDTGRKLSPSPKFSSPTFHDYVKSRWNELYRRVGGAADFESFWIESLARGGFWETITDRPAPNSSGPIELSPNLTAADVAGPKPVPARGGNVFTLMAYPSVSGFDGRGANKPWLQELPDPMTRLTWGTWVEISLQDAERLEVHDGDVIQVTSPYGRYEVPAYVFTGISPGFVAIPIGQGHSEYGRYANGVGVNPITLLDPKPSPDKSGGLLWFGTKVELLKTSRTVKLATVQEADSQEDRGIIQEVLLSTLASGIAPKRHDLPSLYPEQTYPKHRWGMVIDVDKCNGCSACVTACYAENNIPVVGRDEVVHGREMAWIRIDRYFDGPQEPARAKFLPMLCQQCGSAPCETVCPVYATYHTTEGLNAQVYNRCIGTRYCANNCPYKVRRFNWFAHEWPEPLNWQLNPDVTVRSNGVMEKCTFCVQRIVEGKNTARMENRSVRDGEIQTACQQACPAQAITFGDLKDPESSVVKLAEQQSAREYKVLEELNTLPSITYLKRIRI